MIERYGQDIFSANKRIKSKLLRLLSKSITVADLTSQNA